MFNDPFFFNVLMGVVAFLISWFIKSIFSKDDELKIEIKEVRNAVDNLRTEVKKEYQTKELAQQINHGIQDKLDNILFQLKEVNTKLDKKADK